ncbi:hypothetical protein Bpfe_003492 [Biomphalaria pfeifferi]|uniref:Uncharacterized protein n=1 Tax=Biomphalaria pfeifferi TaxID=112525 RepID=A0AAD8C6C9_BIOPF|nr:hypothetical protein Bpfe_003492 [Biomphalaria pfeifferi]
MTHVLAITTILLLELRIFAIWTNGVLQNEAVLNDFNRKDLVEECKDFLTLNDTLVMNGEVSVLEKENVSHANIAIMIKSPQEKEFVEIDYVFLNNCLFRTNFYCTPKKNQPNDFDVVLNTTINSQLYDQAKIKLKLQLDKRDIYSKDVELPKLFNLSSVHLTIDGMKLTSTNKTVTLESESFTLCCHSLRYPCNVVVFAEGHVHETRSKCYTHTTAQTMKYRLGYFVCGSEHYSNHFDVLINIVSKSSAAEVSTSSILIIVFSTAAIIVLVAVLICVYRWIRKPKEDKGSNLSPTATRYPKEKDKHVTIQFESANKTSTKARKRGYKK